jgi:hypothetical protein
MKLSDLKLGQKVSINGIPSEYQGIRKVKIPNFGKVEKEFSEQMKQESIYIIISLMEQKHSKVWVLNCYRTQ